MRIDDIQNAAIPTWIKSRLLNAARASDAQQYIDLGWQIANQEFRCFEGAGDRIVEVSDQDIAMRATMTLRRLFRTEDHPQAEFVELIPDKYHGIFLSALVHGLAGQPMLAESDAGSAESVE